MNIKELSKTHILSREVKFQFGDTVQCKQTGYRGLVNYILISDFEPIQYGVQALSEDRSKLLEVCYMHASRLERYEE